jgi:antitoxin component YwqK of YwqJK toxin-antitoxin module
MKNIIAVLFLSLPLCLTAQQKDTVSWYINHDGKPVDYRQANLLRIGIRQDTLWAVFDLYLDGDKINMKGWCKDDSLKIKHGPFEYYSKSGKLISRGVYFNNKKLGLWRQWYENGAIRDSAVYKNGVETGLSVGYYENGTTLYKKFFDTEGNGNGTDTVYYLNGNTRHYGTYLNNERTGTWIYWRDDNSKASEIKFEADSAIAAKNFDTNGKLISSSLIEREANYPGGENAWNNYIAGRLMKLYDKKDYDSYVGSCSIQFDVEKDGSIKNAEVVESSNKKLSDLAIGILLSSKKWIPAIQYNLPVKAYRRQRFTFSSPTD